jgi:hypothetical protein
MAILVLLAVFGAVPVLSVSANDGEGMAMSEASAPADSRHVSGIVHKIHGAAFSLENRNNQTLQVDAQTVNRIKSSRAMWPDDK